jgi:hypothetical protein
MCGVVQVYCVVWVSDLINSFIHSASHVIIVSHKKFSYLLYYISLHHLVLFHHSFAVNICLF